MAIQNDSSSEVIQLVGVSDRAPRAISEHDVPLPGPRGFVDIQSRTSRSRKDEIGTHTLRYRSLLGRRLKVDATATMTGARYVTRPPLDELSPDGSTWGHHGDSSGGTKRWNRVGARYVRDDGSRLPTVDIEADISSDAPLERVVRATRSFPVE